MKSKTILLAYQDDSWIRSLLTLLPGTGYRIEATKLVSDVLQKIRGKDPYVVLLDDEMEGIKAYDLVPLFKKVRPRVQIIVISSDESIRFAKCLRDAGIFYQAMKPIDSEEIRSAVACAFEKIDREQPEKWFFPFLTPGPVPA
jgi:DNA-binding NtrC family response regulator